MPPIKVGDVDRQSGKIVLRDTKNRSDHKLLLSKQALEIVESNRLDRKANELVFSIVDARKTLAWINAQAGTAVQGHGLRASLASIAWRVCPFVSYGPGSSLLAVPGIETIDGT